MDVVGILQKHYIVSQLWRPRLQS